MRRLALETATKSTDIVSQRGASLRVTTVNARGAWARALPAGREVVQRDAEGRLVRTRCAWDGPVHKATHAALDGGRVLDSWRHADGGLMLVRSALRSGVGPDAATREPAVALWFLEAVAVPPVRRLCGLATLALPLARDAARIARACDRDTAGLQSLARRKTRWETPADVFSARAGRASGAASPTASVSRSGSPSRGARRTTAGSSDAEAWARRLASARGGGSTDSDALAAASVGAGPGSSVAGAAGGSSVGGRWAPPPRLQPPRGDAPSPAARPSAPTSRESAFLHRLAEYADNRSLTSVVPVDDPLAAAAEPELLEMSPDQAEATQLKLSELARAVRRATPRRAAADAGADCGCCTVTLNAATVPAYCRAWDALD